MSTLRSFHTFIQSLPKSERKMPVLFVGHGSPMNGIEDNLFSKYWTQLGREIPMPKAVLCISAHWLTKGTHVTAMLQPRTIHDFGGFPDELYQIQYPAPGDPGLAGETVRLIKGTQVVKNHDWGLDHGCWSIVRHMYPAANIPVLQLSIDFYKPAQFHYELAKELKALRKRGVLVMGSGNMVHNLRMVAWDRIEDYNFGYDWAIEINETFKNQILANNHDALLNYSKLGKAAQLAVPAPDHYYPLLYTLGLQDDNDEVTIFNDHYVAGSLSMASVKFES